MRIIRGNKKLNINEIEYKNLITNYKDVILDLGTGDGRFVYKNALANKSTFYIGLDPSEKSLEEFSKKAVKEKVSNTLFVVLEVEQLPIELNNTINEIYINLPWGSLLQAVIKPSDEIIENLIMLFKDKCGTIKILFGFNPSLEPSETQRLELTELSEEFINNQIIPAFIKHGFYNTKVKSILPDDLKKIDSTWGKKISSTLDRKMFYLELHN